MEDIPVNELSSKQLKSLQDAIVNFIKLQLPSDEEEYVCKIMVELFYILSKNQFFLKLRQSFWKNNYGVPALDFLLFSKKIFSELVEKINEEPAFKDITKSILSNLEKYKRHIKDNDNNLYDLYEKPNPDSSGSFIATVNKQGFMTTAANDCFSVQFIERAEQSSSLVDGRVLEIGAAYGVASLAALKRGATVVCNDLEPEHLAVVVKEHLKIGKGTLTPVAGSFPDELVFNDNQFDAILISRVLHFFDGEQLINALKKARKWLKIGGSLFVVNETPYLLNWGSFLDEYTARKHSGEKWPGLINNTKKYEKNRSGSLPPLVHWLDEDTLLQALNEAGFADDEIQISYINREGQFPPDMLMKDMQKESVGCRATRLG